MATRKSKPKETELDIQLLTTAKCPSISGAGTEIRYSIGVLDDDIYIKLVSSSGGGQINNTWIPFEDILNLLESKSEGVSFNSSVFSPIYPKVSSNNCGFTLAVALKENLVLPKVGNRRKFVYNDPAAFLAKVEKLTAAKASKPSPRRKAKATA
jgi:hypothetical protein